jgi:peptidyl-dipeptidase Dcp
MRRWLFLAIMALAALPIFAQQTATSTASSNPFFEEWATPFGVPPFGRIRENDYLPAFKEGIARKRKEIEKIARSTQPPTFASTIATLDKSGDFLDRVELVFNGQLKVKSTDALQAIAREVSPMLSSLDDDINFDEALFERVKTLWEVRETLELTQEQRKLLEDRYMDFVRGGANLDAAGKERLRAINKELSLLGLKFRENVLKETNAFKLVIENKDDLAGLPPDAVTTAEYASREAGLEGKWVITLQAPSIWPFLQYADSRELRQKLLTAYVTRADHGDACDNKAVLSKTAALRAEKANLLGYPTWADFVLDRNMAKSPAKVYALLDQVWAPALRVARSEAADLQVEIEAEGGDFALEPWDWRYYAAKVRKSRFDLDQEELRPYFELNNVLKGAFYVAEKLYGTAFIEQTDIPKYNPDVRTFKVKDADGSFLGVFMTDYYPRPGKRGGSWCGRYRMQCVRDGKDIRPIVVNVCNFPRPTAGAPALLSLEDSETLFHEFGHALNMLFSRVDYKGSSWIPPDFVELPSQIMENWALEPDVLKVYARHWKTEQVIPVELVARVEKSRTFGQGFANVEYLAACYLDMEWHTLRIPSEEDATAFERASMAKINMLPEIIERYRSPYFMHIFGPGGSYSAGYYSYIWADVLEADAFEAFTEKGIFDPGTAKSFRVNILERTGAEDAMAAYIRFRGREPSVEPFLVKLGLKEAETPKTP